MITQVTYERVYNLGNYQSERLTATATAPNGDAAAAFDEARGAVEAYYAQIVSDRQSEPTPQPAEYTPPAPPPATDGQRRYIAALQDKIGWNSEQFAAYANEQRVDLAGITKSEASAFIDGLKLLADERSTPRARPGVVEEADIPW